jgi:hypothetical protein
MDIEKLAETYTEDQLRAALEIAKTREGEARAAKFKENTKFLVCKCGERASYVSRPESVQYLTTRLFWNDEDLRLSAGSGELESCPGDDEYKNPVIDDYIAFAWCGGDECEWFALGTERETWRKFEKIRY